MYGRRSLFLDLKEYYLEIERSVGRRRAKKCEYKEKMAEGQISHKQLKEYFTIATYDSSTSTRMPAAMRPFEIKRSLIQIVPSFYGLGSENPFNHVDAFLKICSSVFFNNVSSDAFCLHLFSFSLKD